MTKIIHANCTEGVGKRMDDRSHQRWILHADMDAFYASVEQRDNPELIGKPVIVGGNRNRGVVCAASYEARKYGIRSAMSIVEAKRRCSHGIYIEPNISKYVDVSSQILQIFERFSPTIETLALDEAFLDITGMERLYCDVADIARQLKMQIKNELHLIVSVGVAPNKFLAKLASALEKPDGLVVIHPGEEIERLASLSVKKIWGIGEATAKTLKSMHIETIEELRQADPYILKRHFGKHAIDLYDLAWGRDERPVIIDKEAKSIGNEVTFQEDISGREELMAQLLALAERVGWRLRKAGAAGRTITLKVRFSSFRTITRAMTLTEPIMLDEILYEHSIHMMDKIETKEAIRLLGITVSNFSQCGVQLNLFDEETEKREKIATVMDSLKSRFGVNIVKRGRLLENK